MAQIEEETKATIIMASNLELCRICLDVGAEIPIFEKLDPSDECIGDKLFSCIKQKLEDTAGYPRQICFKCNSTIELLCLFVKKLQDTNKTLLQGLPYIKQEQELFSDNEYHDENFIEKVKINKIDEKTNIKQETLSDDENCMNENFISLFHQDEITIRKFKVESEEGKKKKYRPKIKNKTNNIASSILEGTFEWTGSKWCVIAPSNIKKVKPKKIRKSKFKEKPKREPAIKIPKVANPTTSTFKLCDICGKTLKQSDSLRLHRKIHEAPANVECTKCRKIFKHKDHLKKHFANIHREKKFICSVCGSGFTVFNQLQIHTRKVHEKHLHPPKIFQCSFCPKSYKAKISVEIHERSVHTGLRPAVCSVCDASFFHEEYLKQHMRLHTGETPFKCPVCSRGYAQRGNMKSHMQHNHRLSQLTEEQLKTIKPSLLKVLKP